MDIKLLKALGYTFLGVTKKGENVYKKVSSFNGSWNASKGAVNAVSPNAGGLGGKYDIITTNYAIFPQATEIGRDVRRMTSNTPTGQHSNWYFGDGISHLLNSKEVSYINNRRFG